MTDKKSRRFTFTSFLCTLLLGSLLLIIVGSFLAGFVDTVVYTPILAVGCIGFVAFFVILMIRDAIMRQKFRDIPYIYLDDRLKRKYEEDMEFDYDMNYVDVKSLPKDSKCMISKTTFDNNDRVVQCHQCESYFLKIYLINWLIQNNACPVCKTTLKAERDAEKEESQVLV